MGRGSSEGGKFFVFAGIGKNNYFYFYSVTPSLFPLVWFGLVWFVYLGVFYFWESAFCLLSELIHHAFHFGQGDMDNVSFFSTTTSGIICSFFTQKGRLL